MPSVNALAKDGAYTTTEGGKVINLDGGGNIVTDGPIDDRTEEVRLAGYLANVFTTRSDYFTAYIVVQGFSDDWKNASESGQFVVVFDRTNVTDGKSLPRIVGLQRIK